MIDQAVVEEARAMLALFGRSQWRDLHVRTGGYEMFFARLGGARNPMARAGAEPGSPGGAVKAPHLGLFFANLAVGTPVDAETVVGQIEVLGEREDIVAGRAGQVAAILVGDGQLVEYATPLVRIAA